MHQEVGNNPGSATVLYSAIIELPLETPAAKSTTEEEEKRTTDLDSEIFICLYSSYRGSKVPATSRS